MLRADVVVAEGERFAQRKLEDLLRARGEGNLPGRHLVALADDPRDLGPHLLERNVERLEGACCDALLLAEQPEQQMLGADVVVLERARLVLCEDDDLASPLREAFEHAADVSRLAPGTSGHAATNEAYSWHQDNWHTGRYGTDTRPPVAPQALRRVGRSHHSGASTDRRWRLRL